MSVNSIHKTINFEQTKRQFTQTPNEKRFENLFEVLKSHQKTIETIKWFDIWSKTWILFYQKLFLQFLLIVSFILLLLSLILRNIYSVIVLSLYSLCFGIYFQSSFRCVIDIEDNKMLVSARVEDNRIICSETAVSYH